MAQTLAIVAGQGFQAVLQDAPLLDHPRAAQVDRRCGLLLNSRPLK